MPDTVIDRINKIACNEPNQFIFIDHRGCPIGGVDIKGVDRDTYDSNVNRAPQ